MVVLRVIWMVSVITVFSVSAGAADFTIEQDSSGLTVKLDGQLFTRYVINAAPKPFLWPIIGPTGAEVTRGYPMREASESERQDHVHQRSMWFTHGDVNGTSFWHENKGHGTIRHREFIRVEGGSQGNAVTRNDWEDAAGNTLCSDITSMVFDANAESRWIDYDITIKANEKPVTFGDTKEGCFGLRVAGTMKVDAGGGGRIVNSAGQTDKDAWGKIASWVDYHGPVDGETIGIAIMNHPSSFRFPTYWHVRTYGLFAANPFGLHNFQNSDDVDGSHTLQPGESMTLRYRVYIHKGDAKAGRVADAYSEYAKIDKGQPPRPPSQ